MQKIRDSGLASAAKVYIGITMPKHVYDTNGVPLYSMVTKNRCSFEQALREYIEYRYPWANIIEIRDSNDKNLYEGHTLDLMYRYCSPDAYVLYTHTKGLYSTCFNVATWREVLEHFMINKWKECTDKLDKCDLITIKDTHIINSGNMYWAKGSYIKSLVPPLESNRYIPEENNVMYPDGELFRYAFELWITSNNPVIDTIHEITCNPYHDYWLLERLADK